MEPGVDSLFYIDTSKATGKKESTDSFHMITNDDAVDESISEIKGKKKKSRRRDVILGYDEEEAELEQLVFGGKPENLFKDESVKGNDNECSYQRQDRDSFSVIEKDEGEATQTAIRKRKPAWVDDDDETLRIDIKDQKRFRKLRTTEEDSEVDGIDFSNRLRNQFEKIVGRPEWASKESKNMDSDDEEEFFRSTRNYLGSSESLPPNSIEIRRVKDANISRHSNASIKCLEFHPFSKVVLTAGMNKTLNLFQIDGEANPSIQNLFLERFPIHTAKFTPEGQQIVLSSRRKHFYIFDMVSAEVKKIPKVQGRTEKSLETFVISPDGSCIVFLGESGYINLVSLKTTQFICSMKMNGSVKCAAFSNDGSRLFSFGGDGEVYVWDMKTKKCKHKFRDEGCLKGTCIDVSRNSRFVACGSSSGVVNVYDEACFTARDPKPIKTLMNLTTPIHTVKFNPTSEILAFSSVMAKDAIRLLHIPSLTVFSNWPTRKGNLGNVRSVVFSSQSGYLGIGNDSGKAMLYRLRHYPDG